MNRTTFTVALLAATLAAPAPGVAAGGAVTVFAAASLREAFEAAAPAFTKKTGISVIFNFGGSDTLETQIAEGAPADVFASANAAQMQKAADGGLLAAPPATFAHNRLVAIVPKDNPGRVASIADFGRSGVRVVLAAATVPVGGYARKAFANLAGKPGYGTDFAGDVEKNVLSNELDVKAVATKIELGEGDAGVVYATDVTPEIAPKVDVVAFPAGAAPDAVYPIAPLKAAPNPGGAAAFVAFVLGEGQSFLKARGFIAP